MLSIPLLAIEGRREGLIAAPAEDPEFLHSAVLNGGTLVRITPFCRSRWSRIMPSYPVRVIPGEERSVVLMFHDFLEAAIVGESEDDAFEQAPGVLDAILEGYVAEGKPLPQPSDICGAPSVASRRF